MQQYVAQKENGNFLFFNMYTVNYVGWPVDFDTGEDMELYGVVIHQVGERACIGRYDLGTEKVVDMQFVIQDIRGEWKSAERI